jgi:hypothetical protein
MSTTRIIDGVEYAIPPGTEHIWTPPTEVVVTPALSDVSIEALIDRLRVHKIVRLQNEGKIENLVTDLEKIWSDFKNKSITSQQLAEQLSTFRTTKLIANEEVDDITVQSFEESLIKIMSESTK